MAYKNIIILAPEGTTSSQMMSWCARNGIEGNLSLATNLEFTDNYFGDVTDIKVMPGYDASLARHLSDFYFKTEESIKQSKNEKIIIIGKDVAIGRPERREASSIEFKEDKISIGQPYQCY